MNEILKSLTIKALHIDSVKYDKIFKIDETSLLIKNEIEYSLFEDITMAKIQIVEPYKQNICVNSILDIIPISTKVYGNLGLGLTHTLTGVYVLLTASINEKEQPKNFGACYGNLDDVVVKGKVGTFSESDFIIHIDITIKEDVDMKKAIHNAHLICEKYIQNIRNELKVYDGSKNMESHLFEEKYNKKGKRVVLLKQISGGGAMENNVILPKEPSGVVGGITIMDYKNTPIVLSPNEYRDGAIRSLN
ncbi:MAG: proline reductase cluster protein PrdD [Lachnospirales bacterium]